MLSASLLAPLAAAVVVWLLLRCVPRLEAPTASESFNEAARTAAAQLEVMAEAFREIGRAVDDAIPAMRRLTEMLSSRGRDA